ncbi:MAG: homoserine O-acetyltransferase [Alphaproteobacteria bacterium GM7ARS4]|nr:homoserine O-acetyltransferase [Alphaproteobacteria bacterium GM7ARS4]
MRDDKSKIFTSTTPLTLESGASLPHIDIAYRTWGTLNAQRSNAILLCHALSGDQHATGTDPLTHKAGWWHEAVGPNKAIDTKRYFVICSNTLGGCMGTTGPQSLKDDGTPWAMTFPVITIRDMVRAQKRLIDHLGIRQLYGVIGGSMGGMQVLEWACLYPDHVFCAIPIATTARVSAQNIAFHVIGRHAIMADPHWQQGNYASTDKTPEKGLAVARMLAHITYLSEQSMHRKFGRNLRHRDNISYGFNPDFEVETYLHHQGQRFVARFDANAYLYITRAMDYFDLADDHQGQLERAFSHIQEKTRFLVISFSSDWLFSTTESRHIVQALHRASVPVSFSEIQTDKGHDAFLLHEPQFHTIMRAFLHGMQRHHAIKTP